MKTTVVVVLLLVGNTEGVVGANGEEGGIEIFDLVSMESGSSSELMLFLEDSGKCCCGLGFSGVERAGCNF